MYSKIHHDGWRSDWPTVLQLASHLTEGVAAVHAAGILHRDLKPGNVLLDDDNMPYICDFGIAIPIADLHSNDAGGSKGGKPTGGFNKRNMVGTLEYMSPETLQKQVPTDKSDVWALAVTLNELATGVFPYSDCTQDNPAAHTVLEMGYGRSDVSVKLVKARPCFAIAQMLRMLSTDLPPAAAKQASNFANTALLNSLAVLTLSAQVFFAIRAHVTHVCLPCNPSVKVVVCQGAVTNAHL